MYATKGHVSHDIAYTLLLVMDQHKDDAAMRLLGLETLNMLW